jgi:ATP-dependent helicase HrpB
VESLPIDAYLGRARASLLERGALVLTAQPGAGKTTRLPPALLEGIEGQVWVLEPRRLAARLAAKRVAEERGERLGETIGYQVRFDKALGPTTRVRYVTEGILARRLAAGGDLDGVGAVVLDEFHERHLETDLCLCLLDALRRGRRPDLRLVVMSATLEAEAVASHLHAPVIDVPGRLHPVTIEHAPTRDDRALEDQVHAAVSRLVDEGLGGHVLVFLPGVGEIRRCQRALGGLARHADLVLHPLHGSLPLDALETALRPSARRKVLLATNLAESSVTLDGVEAVVDAGLERVAGHAPGSALPSLELRPIAQASAIQRANRAGRQSAGRCLRLYTRNDFERRPATTEPELLRLDLAPVVLSLRGAGVDPAAVRWLDPPPPAALSAADGLLQRLGAVDPAGQLTATGRELLRLPLSPRLGRVLLEGRRRGIPALAADAMALLSERDLLRGRRGDPDVHARSDVLVRCDLLDEARRATFRPGTLQRLGLDAQGARRVDRVARQLRRRGDEDTAVDPEQTLLLSLLAGHPDRVARRQGPRALALAEGGTAELSDETAVRESEWVLVLDATDPRRHGRKARARIASAIEPDWLLDLFPDALREEVSVRWNPAQERVESTWQLRYGGLVVESSAEQGEPTQVAEALYQAACAKGAGAFTDPARLDTWRRRVRFARSHDPDLPGCEDHDLDAALRELCQGRRSFAELRQVDLLDVLQGGWSYEQRRQLDRLAPAQVQLAGGRRLAVTYEPRQPPWVKSRLQDFFGMAQGPAVAGGEVPLVLHLLAPNKQAVSVTSDLAGFWERHYPAARRELGRRYPKHAWPEDPLSAKAPKPGRVR